MIRFCLATILLLSAMPAAASAVDGDQPYIAVVGVGEARAVPTQVSLQVSVTERAATSSEASRRQRDKVAAVVALLRRALGGDISLTTDTVSLNPFRVHTPDNPGDDTTLRRGFEAYQTLTFVLREKAQAEALYPKLTTEIDSIRAHISFSFAAPTALYAEARTLALKSARARAESYAKNAGVTLGRVLIIEESGTETQRIPFDLQDRVTGTFRPNKAGGYDQVVITGARLADAEGADVILAPEAQSVSVTLYAKFAIK